MNKKIIGILALCVIGLAIVAFQLWNDEPKPAVQDVVNQAAQPKEPKINALPQEKPVKPPQKPIEEVPIKEASIAEKSEDQSKTDPIFCEKVAQYDDWYPQGDSYESQKFMEEAKAWAFARGYFETEYSQGSFGIKKQSDYDFYALEDLEEMAQAGDSMANVRLAYRLYLKGDNDNMAKAQPYCDRAIADGYTALIMCKAAPLIAEVYEEQRKDSPNNERLKELELQIRAWKEAADEFGDPLVEQLVAASKSLFKHELDEDEVLDAVNRLQQDIQQQRQQLGLGPMKHPPMPDLLAYVLENDIDNGDDLNACFE